MTKILSLGLVLCLLAFGIHGRARAECITATAWVANVVKNSTGVQVIRVADLQGPSAKAALLRLNEVSTPNKEADHIIVLGGLVAATNEPKPYFIIATFFKKCGVLSARVPPDLARYVLRGGAAPNVGQGA